MLLFSSLVAFGQKSDRDYYNELVKADGLDGMTNYYVCFQDKPSENFMTFSKSEDLKRLLAANKFPSKIVQGLSGHWIALMGYTKGVQWPSPTFLDQETIVGDPKFSSYTAQIEIKGTPAILRFNINWKTLRYVYEVLDRKRNRISDAASFGKCEDRTREAK